MAGRGVKSRPSGGINWTDVNWYNWQNSLVGQSSVINGQTIYWTNSIKPLAPVNHVYGPNPPNSGVSEIPPEFVMEFVDYLNADPTPQTVGGYKGANFWRADLHGAAQWTNIQASTIGSFTGIINNIVIDDPTATSVGAWTSTRTFYNGTFYGNGSGTDFNSFGTNYLTSSQGTGAAYVQFTPNILVAGDYDVYQWHPSLAECFRQRASSHYTTMAVRRPFMPTSKPTPARGACWGGSALPPARRAIFKSWTMLPSPPPWPSPTA